MVIAWRSGLQNRKKEKKNMNKVILIGRLTKNPEIKTTQQGFTIARYSLAVTRKFKQQSDTNVDFINCVAFGKIAEIATQYLDKGIKIAIVGRIQVRSWNDQNGQKQWSTDVVVEEQYFMENKKQTTEQQEQDTGFYPVYEEDESLPF